MVSLIKETSKSDDTEIREISRMLARARTHCGTCPNNGAWLTKETGPPSLQFIGEVSDIPAD